MHSSDKLLAIFSLLATLIILGSVAFSTNYYKHQNTKIVELIKAGVSPVAAMCAVQDDLGNHPTCVILAAEQASGQ